MNEKTIHGDYARTLMELRARAPWTPRPERRKARTTVAARLHRLADRLEGN